MPSSAVFHLSVFEEFIIALLHYLIKECVSDGGGTEKKNPCWITQSRTSTWMAQIQTLMSLSAAFHATSQQEAGM